MVSALSKTNVHSFVAVTPIARIARTIARPVSTVSALSNTNVHSFVVQIQNVRIAQITALPAKISAVWSFHAQQSAYLTAIAQHVRIIAYIA
jgi:hypothetical protein